MWIRTKLMGITPNCHVDSHQTVMWNHTVLSCGITLNCPDREFNPMFEGNMQHDAQELLRCLLCYLEDSERELHTDYANILAFDPSLLKTPVLALSTSDVKRQVFQWSFWL